MVTQPFVQDVVYVVGTLKIVKIHFNPLPKTLSGINCESKLAFVVERKEAAWSQSQRIPGFMEVDRTNRVIKILIHKGQASGQIGNKYQIRVRSFINGHQS